jgi:hypothetical protein
MRSAKWNLKKQTQFASGQVGVKSYLKEGYGNKPPGRADKNKPNRLAGLRIWVIKRAGRL